MHGSTNVPVVGNDTSRRRRLCAASHGNPVDDHLAYRALPSPIYLFELLGITTGGLDANFFSTGRVGVMRHANGKIQKINRERADSLVQEIYSAMLGIIQRDGPIHPKTLRARFDDQYGGLFVHGTALQRWVDHWIDRLVAAGLASRGLDGHIRRTRRDQGKVDLLELLRGNAGPRKVGRKPRA